MSQLALPQVILKRGKAGAAIGRHPWVFSGMIDSVDGDPQDGDPVKVLRGEDRAFVAYGLHNSKSEIRIRLYSWNEAQSVDEDLFRRRIEAAVALRKDVLGLTDPSGARRLIFSEADGLSGLTVDEYGPYLVFQVTSAALHRKADLLADILSEIRKPKGILLRSSGEMAKKEGMPAEDRVLFGDVPTGRIPFVDHGIEFDVDLWGGQKTGFFLDQTENRVAAAQYAKGARVLDLYCYTGAFALHCARAGAKEVVGVDSSGPAIQQADETARRNRFQNARFVEDDVFRFLEASVEGSYSLIIVDPPRFAAARENKNNALRKYHRVNSEAMKRLERGGMLVTCSCSGRVSMHEFMGMLGSAARRSGRFLQVLELRGASRDHPFTPFCPESQYLKCVIARAQ
ncbi:MAG: class I SAM-dependent rRNA methyltransferase [Pseudomonadota bacterium]